MGSIVPAGSPFTITWTPTTTGTVTIVLLKGPSTNVIPQYPIAQNIANSGSFTWTPATDLVPSPNDMGYGLQLIVDATGQYQYSTQFGISNAAYGSGSMSMSSSATGSATGSMTMSAPSSYTTGMASNSTVSVLTISSTMSSSAASNMTMTTMAAASTSAMSGPSMTSASAPAATQSNVAGQLAASFGGVVAIMAAVAAF